MQNTNPSLITPSPHPTIKLPRIKIFKTGFKKTIDFDKILGITHVGVGGRLICVIMTHCVGKLICDSPTIWQLSNFSRKNRQQ